jgi:hypothetical protein
LTALLQFISIYHFVGFIVEIAIIHQRGYFFLGDVRWLVGFLLAFIGTKVRVSFVVIRIYVVFLIGRDFLLVFRCTG